MATYTELRTIQSDHTFRDRIASAIVIAAENLRASPPPPIKAEDSQWIVKAFSSPTTEAMRFLEGIVARNNTLTVAAILGLSDAQIQADVNALMQVYIDADAGV